MFVLSFRKQLFSYSSVVAINLRILMCHEAKVFQDNIVTRTCNVEKSQNQLLRYTLLSTLSVTEVTYHVEQQNTLKSQLCPKSAALEEWRSV